MATTNAYSFTRTGRTWGVLLLAAIAWLIVSLWAFRVAATQIEPHGADTAAFEHRGQEQASAEAAGEAEELEIAKRETAERRSAETELAERAVAERQAAEIEPAESETADSAAAAREPAEQQMALAAKSHAAEQARLAARLAAEHQIRLRAQTQSATEVAELSLDFEPQEVKVDEEALAERQAQAEREAQAEDEEALAEREAQAEREAENAREAAAQEARRVATDAARISAYEHLRQKETGTLVGLSERLQFQGRSEVIDREFEQILDRVFEPLFLYAEMSVVISVATNEYQGPADNNRLSRDRARSIVTYLVNRGLQEERFNIQAGSDEGLPYGSHRVRVSVEDPIQ